MDVKTKDFLVYVINIMAVELFGGRKDLAYSALRDSGLLEFYADTYETSHTLGSEYLLEEIKERLGSANLRETRDRVS
jgi:hypothetical protein